MRTSIPRRKPQRIAIHDPLKIPKIATCIQEGSDHFRALLTKLTHPEGRIPAIGRTEHRCPPPFSGAECLRSVTLEPVILAIESLERHGAKRIRQMNDPNPLKIPIRRQRPAQLRLEKWEPDKDRIPINRNTIHLYPLGSIPHIKNLPAGAILDIEIENNIVPILSF